MNTPTITSAPSEAEERKMTSGRLIKLSEQETASLIRESPPRSVLPLAFEPGWCALKADQAPWAVRMLLAWRGLTFADGAGI